MSVNWLRWLHLPYLRLSHSSAFTQGRKSLALFIHLVWVIWSFLWLTPYLRGGPLNISRSAISPVFLYFLWLFCINFYNLHSHVSNFQSVVKDDLTSFKSHFLLLTGIHVSETSDNKTLSVHSYFTYHQLKYEMHLRVQQYIYLAILLTLYI